jgi:hypothetical protein
VGTKTKAQTQPEAPAATLEPVVHTEDLPVTTQLTLEQMIAIRKEMDAQIKAQKGKSKPTPKQTSLDDVVAKQRELPGRWVVLGLLSQTVERASAGQDFAEALAQVVGRYTELAREVLDGRLMGESLQDATWRHLREAYPKTNARTGPGAKARADASEDTDSVA